VVQVTLFSIILDNLFATSEIYILQLTLSVYNLSFVLFYLLKPLYRHLEVKQNDKAKCEVALNFLGLLDVEVVEAN